MPGHAADHLVLYEPTHRLLFTGDLVFVGKVGGTKSDEDAATEWNSLRRVLDTFPNDATIWPGHDYGVRPSSTLAIEKRTNPFLLWRRPGRISGAETQLARVQGTARPEVGG